MFSTLDQIFKTRFRETEAIDARMAIRRQTPDDRHDRPTDHKASEENNMFGDDQTSISITALKIFLQELLVAQEEPEHAQENAPQEPDQKPKNPSGDTAKAASAYQKTWDQTHPETTLARQPAPQNTGLPSLSETEIKKIKELLQNIENIIAHQPDRETLTLQKGGDDFLDILLRSTRDIPA